MFTFTSESVSAGHPDKIADQISDAILDEYMRQSPDAHTAVEVMVTSDYVILAGEVKGPEIVHKKIEEIVRGTIRNIGYESEHFHWDKVKIKNLLHQQSKEIIAGITSSGKVAAGDQGIMFGYANSDTDQFMPAPIYYAHNILRNIFQAVYEKGIPKLGPDAKSQVTLLYKDKVPVGVTNIVVSIQHPSELTRQDVFDSIYEIVKNTFPDGWMCNVKDFFVNPSGKFTVGGPVSDCGLTGRKIMVDTYGGFALHGGGAFSGKDSTKVDRSAAYMARYIAKNIVASGLASECLIGLAYAIGIADPVSLTIDTYGTNNVDESVILDEMEKMIDLSPRGIRQLLGLNNPIYLPTATYGHFGKEASGGLFPWEKLDLSIVL